MYQFKKLAARITAATALATSAALTMGGLAYADTLQDTIDDNGTGVTLVAGSDTAGTASIRVVGNNAAGDPDPGCNIDAGENPLKLDVVTPAGVTATPDPLSITSCGTDFSVSFTASSAAVSGHATVTVLSGPAGGGTYVNQVDILITITQPAPTNTAPVVSVTGVANGATYEKSNVPQPGCSVTDAEDANESATPQITGGAHDALGSHTVTCSYTDGGGMTRSAEAAYTVVRDKDTTAPVITKTVTGGTMGNNGWYTDGIVSLDWTVTEDESPGTLVLTGCDDVTVSADQAATDYDCSATSEGGTAAKQTVSIKRDSIAPTVSNTVTVDGTEGSNGWYKSNVDVTFTATDSLSGPATATKTVTSSGQGEAVEVESPSFSDAAGNTTAEGAVSKSYKIDTTAPSEPTFVGGATSYYFGDTQTKPTCTATDAVSGFASCNVSGGGTTVGTHTYTATATDNAGHTSTSTKTYTVKAWTLNGFFSPVDMNGVWNTVKGGSSVPLKFKIFSGTTELKDVAAIDSFTVKSVTCPGGSAATDDIELTTTGGTSLRYDTTGGQFIQNWQTPKKPGTCYTVTMKTDDGSSISANFLLK
jgi:hypothetical protein